MTPTSLPGLVADLRARRRARGVIEAHGQLDAFARGLTGTYSPEEHEALCDALREAVGRLARASVRLPERSPLRNHIDDVCAAHAALDAAPTPADEARLEQALAALQETMRRTPPSPAASPEPTETRHTDCNPLLPRRS